MTDIKLPPLPEPDGFITDGPICRPIIINTYRDSTMEAYAREAVRLNAGRPHVDAGLDVEAVLRLFLTGDGFIAECDIPHIVAALTAQPAASAEPVAWVAADTLNTPHPTCISSLAYMSQFDKDRGREYVPLYAAPVAAQQGQAKDCHCATCTCQPWMTPAVRFDTTPADKEGAVRDHLIALGWTPPGAQQAESADQVQALLEALEDLVRINEEHNSAVEDVISRPLDWKDAYLDKARAAIRKARGESHD